MTTRTTPAAATAVLDVGPDLQLPLDIVTDATGLFGRRGSGKSNGGVVLAERMYDAGVPWVAIDPKGDWWGIRSSADGEGEGLPIPVFGGLHGDVPIEPTAGEVIARLVVERNLTCVLDLSDFGSKAKQVQFTLDFIRTLFDQIRRAPRPFHVFADEADELAPQMAMSQKTSGEGPQTQMVGAMAKLVKQGRNYGLGITLMSQRPASVANSVLSQLGTVALFRTTLPEDQDRVVKWIEDRALRKVVAAALSKLPAGTSWLISQDPLVSGSDDHARQVTWARRRTFDSGATPRMGEVRQTPATLADIDLGELQDLMADTIEKAQADDPSVLQRRVRELTAELAEARAAQPAPEVVEVPVPDTAALDEMRTVVERMLDVLRVAVDGRVNDVLAAMDGVAREVREHQQDVDAPPRPPDVRSTPPVGPARQQHRPAPAAAPSGPATVTGNSGPARMLRALAAWPAGLTKAQLGSQAKLAWRGGTFQKYLAELTERGYIEAGGDGRIHATDAGVAAVGGRPAPQTADEVHAYWREKLGDGAVRMLDHLIGIYPQEVSRDDLAVAVDLAASGGTFQKYLGQLVDNQLATVDRQSRAVAGHPNLFP